MNKSTTAQRTRSWVSLLRRAIRGDEQDFTTGSIDRAIVLLSVPMILEMAMESMFAVVDAFFVARVGVAAVATVGLTESMLTVVYSMAIGLSSAASAMVSRRIGEGKRDAAARAGAQTILLALALSALLAVPGYLFADDILGLMSNDPSVVAQGAPYTRLMFGANLPILLLWMLNGIFRGAGDAATAMRALWLANGINMVLDPLLIFGWGPFPELGVLGAGLATTIGRSVGVAYQLWHLFGVGRIIKLKPAHFVPSARLLNRLTRIAAGGTGQYLIASASWIFMISILGQLGKDVTAGYTIAIRIMLFTILPAWGMANAAATLVGQNLGAALPGRAEQAAWRAGYFNVVFMLMVSATYLMAAPFFMRLFTTEPGVVASGALALRIVAGGYVFYGWGMIMAQALNGAGDTRTPTLLNFIFFWLIEMPLGWLLALHWGWGETGVYWSIVLAESGLAVAATWVFSRGRWKLTEV